MYWRPIAAQSIQPSGTAGILLARTSSVLRKSSTAICEVFALKKGMLSTTVVQSKMQRAIAFI
jgi:hypothetical protein